MLKHYKELNVWQKSYQLCLEIYAVTKIFPEEEKYGLTSQMRRSAVSVPSNIAERNYSRLCAFSAYFVCIKLRVGDPTALG
jgi:four helix bundle protein